ncbi:MAG: RNA polymerase sigma factor [Candidatus Acidiferrum sp.]
MGTMRLALPWETRISSEPREREKRVEPAEDFPGRPSQNMAPAAAAEAISEDAELAARCRAGDLGGYERLFARHGARMKNVARNLLGSPVDAEDAVQETFLKVQRSIASFRGQSSFVTWTYSILINTCYDARRSRKRKKEVANEDSEDSPRAEQRAPSAHPSLRMALERALASLTKHQRDVFLLYEVEGFHHAEIAGMLEITETASKNTLFQAKKNLRQVLEPPGGNSASGPR